MCPWRLLYVSFCDCISCAKKQNSKDTKGRALGASNLGPRPSPSWEGESKPISTSSVTEKMSEGLRCAHQVKSKRCGG